MYSAAAFYMQNPELQRFNGGVFSTFRWKGLNNCQKTWAISLLMQMCDCQDVCTSKTQRASGQFKTYCFVLFCFRQTKCQPLDLGRGFLLLPGALCGAWAHKSGFGGRFLPLQLTHSVAWLLFVLDKAFLFFLDLYIASCAWCTIQNMLFILCQTITVATGLWFDFPVCKESQICPLSPRGTLQGRLSGCCVCKQLRKVQIVPF